MIKCKEFKRTFKYEDPIKNDEFEKLKKPEICDQLISTNNYRHHWYKEDNKLQYIEMQKQQTLKKNKKIIFDFKKQFYDLNGREALDSEIIDNLKDMMDYNLIVHILDSIRYSTNSDLNI